MDMVQHIINMNNRSNNSHWYFIDKGSVIVAESKQRENKTFESKDEFLSWFKSYSINSIKNRLSLR
ncbi:hypothetical protein CVD28_00905 [Bacillus sp. M6-12]|uniref:hypothetical protein n=1 Tax=Bacillus sp. M6-12 TaxID=2054166 RepID=UPI000C789635|nr:hypothetical protein [Bacillus sp. M6-12]PLS18992.1 hypothetical protein CVD28_00905 [Bacillus sp. M6-12]